MRQAEPKGRVLLANAVRLWGGGERFVVDAAAGLRARGWSVVVQAQPGSPLAERARAEGVEVHELRTRANGAPWTVLPLATWIHRRTVDVVLTNFDRDLRTTGLAARVARALGTRAVVVHSLECDEPLKRRWYFPLLHRVLTDHLLFNSEATRRTVVESAPWMARLDHSILPKGIDVAAWAKVAEVSVAGREELRFGFLGQLVARKELPALLQALARLRDHSRPWRLRVAGTGPQEDTWRRLTEELRLGDRVRFDGFVEDVRSWMAEVDALVHPSRQEGWGYAVAEAMAAGRVVIARSVSSVPELVGADSAGLYGGATGRTLSEGLLRVLEAPADELREEGCAHRRRAAAELSLDRMLDTLEDRLRAILDLRDEGRP